METIKATIKVKLSNKIIEKLTIELTENELTQIRTDTNSKVWDKKRMLF